MSLEEEDLCEFQQICRGLAMEARSASDLGIKLIDDASARFEDYAARNKVLALAERQDMGLSRLSKSLRYIRVQWQTLTDGPPLPDPIARHFVGQLRIRGLLTRQQLRIVNLYRMIHFGPNGSTDILAPVKSDFSRGMALLVALLALGLVVTMVVWEAVALLADGLPVAYTLGALLGYGLRAAYDSAWGRSRVAMALHANMRWLKIVSAKAG